MVVAMTEEETPGSDHEPPPNPVPSFDTIPCEATETRTGIENGKPAEWKKYASYALEVDPDQDDKAKEIKLCNVSRPHMRAFHCSWWGFFTAFFIWFSIAPLLPEISKDLDLTQQQVWTSNIFGDVGTIFMRFVLGPACDKYGPRLLFAVVLCCASIPTACTGFVQTGAGLSVLRLFIGIAGGSFVMCQFWSSRMFTKEVAGTANALVGGWGNLGGGVTQLVMGSALFPLFTHFYDGDTEKAWRTVCVVPAVIAFLTGLVIYFISDDAPKGNYAELRKRGSIAEISAASSFQSGARDLKTWLLFIQYACSFGVELTMYDAAASYFTDMFDLTPERASAIASLFGWMNLFSRGLGGFTSDKAFKWRGIHGRLFLQTSLLMAEGTLILVFANTLTLGSSIAVMTCFALFVQAAEGSTYAIVPYVNPPSTGSVAGIVGAGGTCGAVAFGIAFQQLSYHKAFIIMGATVLGSACVTVFMAFK